MTTIQSGWDETVDETIPNEVLGMLFEDARTEDEFEFCCSILRVRGMESAGWNPFQESMEMVDQFLALVPLVENKLKVRLTLFLYCHMTEMNDFYAVPANMLRILNGYRYSLAPFSKDSLPPGSGAKYPGEKVRQICDASASVSRPEVGRLYEELLLKEVRNAFYHSDYFLTRDSFVIRGGKGIKRGVETKNNIPFEWLMPRLSLGINTGLAMLDLMAAHRESYSKNKTVRGRMGVNGEYTDVELLATNEERLTGFRSAG